MSNIREYLSESALSDSIMIDKAIEKIAKMTDHNDHSGSAVAGAELLNKVAKGKYKKLIEIFKHIEGIHSLQGSMPYELGQYRFSLLKQMWDDASSILTPSQAERFKGSF